MRNSVSPDTVTVAASHTGGDNTANAIDGDTNTFALLDSGDGNDFRLTGRTDQAVLVAVTIKWQVSNQGIGSAKLLTGPAAGAFTQLVAKSANFGPSTETYIIPPNKRVAMADIPTVRVLNDEALTDPHVRVYEITMHLLNRGEMAPFDGGA